MTAPETRRVVVTDTCVLINLIHVERLPLLGTLPGYEFVIPDHVYEEVTDQEQRQALDEALGHGSLKKEPLTDLTSIELYASLRGSLGSGEAACIAMAVTEGWMIAWGSHRKISRRSGRRQADGVPGGGGKSRRSQARRRHPRRQARARRARIYFLRGDEAVTRDGWKELVRFGVTPASVDRFLPAGRRTPIASGLVRIDPP